MKESRKIALFAFIAAVFMGISVWGASSQGFSQSTAVRYRPATEFVRFAPTNGQTTALTWTSSLNRISGVFVAARSSTASGTNTFLPTTFTTITIGNVLTLTPSNVFTTTPIIDVLMVE